MTTISNCLETVASETNLLPLGQLPAHDAVQDVAPHVHVKHGAWQQRVPHHLARPVAQRHLLVSQPAACESVRQSCQTYR